jgi:hypothetical protein
MSKKLLLPAVVAVALLFGPAAAVAQDPLLTVPICDLDGHCDKSCSVWANAKQPLTCR